MIGECKRTVTEVGALGVHTERVLLARISLHLDTLVNVHTAILVVPVEAGFADLAAARSLAAAMKRTRLIAGQTADRLALLSIGRCLFFAVRLPQQQMLRFVQIKAELAFLARLTRIALVADALARAFLCAVAATLAMLRADIKRTAAARTFLAQRAIMAVRTADHQRVHAQVPNQIFILCPLVVPPVVQRCIVRLVEDQTL